MATAVRTNTDQAFQRCLAPDCGATYDVGEARTSCGECGGLLDVAYEWDRLPVPKSLREFEKKWSRRNEPLCRSGVWRFHDLLPFAPPERVVTIGEGQTLLSPSDGVAQYVGLNAGKLYLQYEGMNPSGSFKDNGMTAAFTHAHTIGAKWAACASTGNTSASLALYCGVSKLMDAIIFIGSGKISYGKLSQALDYGALTLQIAGDFDDAMMRVQQVSEQLGIYLVNSVNPFRLEGQKTIMYRVLESLNWELPDWIVVPGGNLGNSSAFGKAFMELRELGLIDRVPRLAIINAAGANTLHQLFEVRGQRWNGGHIDNQATQTITLSWTVVIAGLRPSPAPSKSTDRSTTRSACGHLTCATASCVKSPISRFSMPRRRSARTDWAASPPVLPAWPVPKCYAPKA